MEKCDNKITKLMAPAPRFNHYHHFIPVASSIPFPLVSSLPPPPPSFLPYLRYNSLKQIPDFMSFCP